MSVGLTRDHRVLSAVSTRQMNVSGDLPQWIRVLVQCDWAPSECFGVMQFESSQPTTSQALLLCL